MDLGMNMWYNKYKLNRQDAGKGGSLWIKSPDKL